MPIGTCSQGGDSVLFFKKSRSLDTLNSGTDRQAKWSDSMHSIQMPHGPALIHQDNVLWPVARAEAEMRAQTSGWWVPGSVVIEIPAGGGVLWMAETPDGRQRLLSISGEVPIHLIAMLRNGFPII